MVDITTTMNKKRKKRSNRGDGKEEDVGKESSVIDPRRDDELDVVTRSARPGLEALTPLLKTLRNFLSQLLL